MFGLLFRLRPVGCYNTKSIPQTGATSMPSRRNHKPSSPQAFDEKFAARVQDTLTEMFCGVERIPFSEPPDSAIRREFWTQCDRLRKKLREVGGQEKVQAYEDMLDRALDKRVDAGWFGESGRSLSEMTEVQLHHEVFLNRNFQLPKFGAGPCNHPKAEKLYEAGHGAVREKLHVAVTTKINRPGVAVTQWFIQAINDLFKEAASMIVVIRPAAQSFPAFSPISTWGDAVDSLASMVEIAIRIRHTAEREAEIRRFWECCRAHLDRTATSQSAIDIESYFQGTYMVLSELGRKMREHVKDRIDIMKAAPDEKFIEYEKMFYTMPQMQQRERTRKWIAKAAAPGLDAETVHSRAIVNLITGETLATETEFTRANFPETMLLDFDRCGMLRCEYKALVIDYIALIAATQTDSLPAMVEYLDDDDPGEIPDLHMLCAVIPTARAALEQSLGGAEESSSLGKMLRARLTKMLLETRGEKITKVPFFPESINAPTLKRRVGMFVWRVGRIKAANFTVHKELYEAMVADEAGCAVRDAI